MNYTLHHTHAAAYSSRIIYYVCQLLLVMFV